MSFIKRLIPGKIKTELKYLLYKLLRFEFNRSGLPLEISLRLNKNTLLNYIDIGANVGHFSESMIKEFEINKGLIIEPLQVHIEMLKKKFDDYKKFKILNVAVSDKDGEADFFINEEFDSVSSLLEINYNSKELEELNISKPSKSSTRTITLDSIAHEFNNEIIDLIKIDVQGAEHLILQSAVEILKKTRLVYTEFSYKPLYNNSSTFYDLYHFMYAQNYILVNVSKGYSSGNGELLQGDAVFVNNLFLD